MMRRILILGSPQTENGLSGDCYPTTLTSDSEKPQLQREQHAKEKAVPLELRETLLILVKNQM